MRLYRTLAFVTILLHLIFASCTEKQNVSSDIYIDLSNQVSSIPYSLFANSEERIVLKAEDRICSGIKRLYVDGDYVFFFMVKQVFLFFKK